VFVTVFNNAQASPAAKPVACYPEDANNKGFSAAKMNIAPAISFLVGAVAATAAVAILIPIRTLPLRAGAMPRLAAGLALVVPLLVVMLVALGSSDREAAGAGDLPVALTSPVSTPEGDWSSVAHAFGGATPANPDVAGAPVEQRAEMSVAQMEAATRAAPQNPAHWLALAQTQRLARDYPAAIKAYAAALKLDDSNPDAWADYADALASANGRRLAGEPAKAIARALALQPTHLKGLWLAASLDMELQKYSDALGRWQQLRAALPAGSPDVAIIDANIAEARGLAGTGKAGG
jgi:cytochrome c-type biogenesis protein CcmH/NrfG